MTFPLAAMLFRLVVISVHILIRAHLAHCGQLPGIRKRASKSRRIRAPSVVSHDTRGVTHGHRHLLSRRIPHNRAFDYNYLQGHKRAFVQ